MDHVSVPIESVEPTVKVVPTAKAPPANLNDLLEEVCSQTQTQDNRANTLVSVLRRYKFWPALQVKKFFDGSRLTLLHNTYKRIDVDHFQGLYDECRSVILDLDAPAGNNVVVTFAQNIPKRMTLGQYSSIIQPTDSCTMSYEGTVITVYYHNGKWHYGTSTCPTVDSSRYFHPTKTHGKMMDECMAKILGLQIDTADVRTQFNERLDKTKAYAFLMVHHENKHIMDYTIEFGAEYMVLMQVSTRERDTLTDVDALVEGVKAPFKFESGYEAMEYLERNKDICYGIFVKREDGSLLKVSTDAVVRREEVDLGNSNVWVNMLHVYMLRLPDYHIKDYIEDYIKTPQHAVNSNGAKISATFVIHTAMVGLCNILYGTYRASTYYNMHTQRYKIIRHVDQELMSTIKFHMAQLRNIQITDHTHRPINSATIMDYLCHHNTMKNMRLLLEHIATNPTVYPLKFDEMECIRVLNQSLKH